MNQFARLSALLLRPSISRYSTADSGVPEHAEKHNIVHHDRLLSPEREAIRKNPALQEPRVEDTFVDPTKASGVFPHPSFANHDSVHFFRDAPTGLRAIVGIHDTLLGPALGGCRVYPYENEAQALMDVLRLSRGMTYKAACAGLPLGGGKAVIMGPLPEHPEERAALMRRFGMFVESLGGRYISAEDVGVMLCDMVQVRAMTKHVCGIPTEMGGSGNPAPHTAHGVYVGLKEAVKFRLEKASLRGIKILVEGCGSVGSRLIEKLVHDEADVYITDTNKAALDAMVKRFGVVAVDPQEKFSLEVDVYSPNALGGVLNEDSIPILKCAVVAGAANNQLLHAQPNAEALKARNILYTPDYICNAGGLVNVSLELTSEGWSYERSINQLTQAISTNLASVFDSAERTGVSTYIAAKRLGIARLEKAAYDQGSHKSGW